MKKPSAPSKGMPVRMQKQNALGGMAPVKKAMGGPVGLPAQAAPRAAQAMAARPALPSQAMGARPFKKGGMAKGKSGC